MKNIKETINRYVSAWDEKTPENVKAALQQCCIPEVTYTDKQTPILKGIDALVEIIMGSHKNLPGRTFSLLTSPEYFDHQCYYSWGINIPEVGERAGHDYVEYNNDNLITRIVGFLPVSS